MYKVFFNDRILYLANSFPKTSDNSYDEVIKYENHEMLKKAISNFEQADTPNLLIYFEDADYLFRQFASYYSLVKAAGGIVSNPDNQVLLIFRRGKWDLPKGKNEREETLEQTAIREVSEETNLQDLTLNGFITDTYHTYYIGNNAVLKQTRWYHLSNSGKDVLIPQVNEDITHAVWVSTDQLKDYYQNMFNSIIEVLEKSGKIG